MQAIGLAIAELAQHFTERGSVLPFTYDPRTSEFASGDDAYIGYIVNAHEMRGDRESSQKFEIETTYRLATRVTGLLHRVGWPRSKKKNREAIVDHLQALGFRKDVQVGRDKDGGFDILWLPPLGAIPIRPIVSLQCKNSHFSRDQSDQSVERAKQSMRRHKVRTAESTYLCCVVYNDYIEDTHVATTRDWGFVPLGISDMGCLAERPEPVIL